jgi:cell division protein FtsW
MKFIKNIQGDRTIWAITALLAIFSFLPVYSAASNLAYTYGNGQTFSFVVKHFMHLFLGFVIIFAVHKLPYRYFKGLSIIMLPVVALLLLYTMFQIDSSDSLTNTKRWISLPFVGFSFQPSTLASVVLMVYVARYLSKIHDKTITFKEGLIPLWLPVFGIIGLIFPANFSTAAIMMFMVFVLAFVGGYPFKYLALIGGAALVMVVLFILTFKAFPDLMPNRVDTWMSRVERFRGEDNASDNYQIEKAKIAIATGQIRGLGPGKSRQKNFLPQSSSDFIFAIIIEEYGLIGGMMLVLFYLWLLFRVVIIAYKSQTVFGSLLSVGIGLPIVFQAFINMGVAVELLPVTGQTLPLISSGGTSIWMTCLAIGILLSVSADYGKDQELPSNRENENPLDVLSEAL